MQAAVLEGWGILVQAHYIYARNCEMGVGLPVFEQSLSLPIRLYWSFFSKDSLPQALGQSTSLSAGATIEPADVPANPKAEPGVGVVERGGSDDGSSTCGA